MATSKVKVDITADGSGFHRVMGGIGNAVTGLKAKLAAAFSVGTVGLITKQMLDFGDSIQTMANNLDISTDSAQRFQWAMRNANVEAGTLTKTLYGLDVARQKALGGDPAAMKGLAGLGLTKKQLETLPKDELLMQVLKGTTDKNRTSREVLLGQLGVPRRAAGAILGAREDFISGKVPIVPRDMIAKLDALGDAFTNIKTIVITSLIPALIAASKAIITWARQFVGGLVERFAFVEAAKRQMELEGKKPPGARAGIAAEAEFAKQLHKMGLTTGGLGIMPTSINDPFYKRGFVPGTRGEKVILTPEQKTEIAKLIRQRDVSLYGESGVLAGEKVVGAGIQQEGFLTQLLGVLTKLEEDLKKPPGKETKEPFVPGVIPFKGKTTKELALKSPESLGTNEFLKIGGALGINVQYRMERLAIQQLVFAQRTADATEEIVDLMRGAPTQEYPPI